MLRLKRLGGEGECGMRCQMAGGEGAEGGPACEHLAHGVQLGGAAAVRLHTAVRSGAQHLCGLKRLIMAGDNQELQSGMQHGEIAHQLQEAVVGDVELDQDEIRVLLRDGGEGAGGAGDGGCNGEIRLCFQQRVKSGGAGGVVIYDDYSMGLFHLRLM
jgi:hypothetical protein